jgi:hypothetical protein
MRLPLDFNIEKSFSQTFDLLATQTNSDLTLATRIFTSGRVAIREEFLERIQSTFDDTVVERVDIRNKENAIKQVNK